MLEAVEMEVQARGESDGFSELDPNNIPMEIEVWDRHHLPEIQSERGSSPVGSKKGGSRRGRSSENPPPVARTLSSASHA